VRALFIDTKDAKAKPWRKWLLAGGLVVSAVLLSVSDLAWVNQAQSGLQQWVERINQDPAPTVVVESVQPQVAIATSPEPAASEAIHNTPPVAPQPSEEEQRQEQIAALVTQWAASWSAKDLDSYFYAYADQFQPEGKKSHTEWVKERKQRIASKSKIAVQVNQLVIEPLDANQMRANFNQIYEADGLQSSTLKTLHLSRQEGVWKITREFTP
jgi:ketosteroid isomerase-like protein